jgi:hypothetical protein
MVPGLVGSGRRSHSGRGDGHGLDRVSLSRHPSDGYHRLPAGSAGASLDAGERAPLSFQPHSASHAPTLASLSRRAHASSLGLHAGSGDAGGGICVQPRAGHLPTRHAHALATDRDTSPTLPDTDGDSPAIPHPIAWLWWPGRRPAGMPLLRWGRPGRRRSAWVPLPRR